jgi:hypothetical protein
VDVRPAAANDVNFSITLRKLVEYDDVARVVSEFDLENLSFAFSQTTLPGSTNLQYTYSVVLNNGATVVITVSSLLLPFL